MTGPTKEHAPKRNKSFRRNSIGLRFKHICSDVRVQRVECQMWICDNSQYSPGSFTAGERETKFGPSGRSSRYPSKSGYRH